LTHPRRLHLHNAYVWDSVWPTIEEKINDKLEIKKGIRHIKKKDNKPHTSEEKKHKAYYP
jgi:hypothetical protein